VGHLGQRPARLAVGAPVSAPPPLRRPFLWLALFALVLALSLPAWEVLSGLYLHAVVRGANTVLALLSVPVRVPLVESAAAAYPGIAGAAALFLVTPRQALAWKLRWMALLLGLLFVLHAGLLLAEVLHLASPGTGEPSLPVRIGQRWGTSLLVVWVWLASIRGRPAPPATD
jgi:hypothetical protein